MNVFIVFAAVVAAFFIALFGAGALLGVIRLVAPGPAARLALERRRAASGAETTKPAVRAAGHQEAGRSTLTVGVGIVPVAA